MPTLADTSRVQLRRIVEATFGVTPVAGNSTNLRVTGESFNYDVKKETSKELRSDRQIGYAVPVSANASGGFNFHLNYAEYDDILASTLQNPWSVYGTNGVGTTFTGTFTATTITAGAAPTGANAFTTLQLGQWFRILAPTNANDGLLLRVSTAVAPTTTVITLDANTPAVVAASVTLCAVQTSRLTNGATQTSFSIEKEFPDVTQFIVYKGQTPGKLNLKFVSAALTDGSIEFMGKSGTRGVVTSMPGTAINSQTYNIHNSATGVGKVWEGNAPLTSTFIKSADLTFDNVQRMREAIGNFGAISIGSGTIAMTGTLEMYFADGALYDKFIANTYTSLVLSSQDESGNGYVITLPRVNLMSSKIVAGAKDQDVMASFEISCLSDDANAVAGLRKTIFIDRVGVAVTP